MTPHFALLLCASASLPPSAERIRPGAAGSSAVGSFESISLHIEVDLPPHGSPAWVELLRTGNFLHLPAEIALEVEAGEGLSRLRMVDSADGTLLDIGAQQLPGVGIAELSLESGGMSLIELLRHYPVGNYQVVGWTGRGQFLAGSVGLKHDLPGLFAVVHPLPGASLSSASATIAWSRSRGAVRYRLEVEDDEDFRIEMVVPASRTSVVIPPHLLQPGKNYEYSLVSEGDNDNEIEIEGSFLARP